MTFQFEDIDVKVLNKGTLATLLCERIGFNKREAVEFVDGFFDTIAKELAAGQDVRLYDFAAFVVREKSSKIGRNPKTGTAVQIAPRRVVQFQQGTKLKAKLNEY